MFTKDVNGDLFICQIYVDDTIFGSTNNLLSYEFATMMSREFEMSKGASLDLLVYSDSDFAGSRVDRKSTSGGLPLAWAFSSLLVE